MLYYGDSMSDLPSEGYDASHKGKVEKAKRQEIFPFKRKHLVDTQTGECPFKPDNHGRESDGFADEPDNRGDVVHNVVERVPAWDVERQPASEEKKCGGTGDDEKIQVFSQIEESEVNTGIFGVIAGGKLALGFGKVERAAVGFGCA